MRARGPAFTVERLSFGALLATLAWAPFPLGSNRPWSWSLLCLLIALSWLLWVVSVWRRTASVCDAARRIFPAILCGGLALLWAALQVCPLVPASWAHPVWKLAGDALGLPLSGVISIDPWRTTTEFMKLLAYAMTFWMTYVHAVSRERARIVLLAVIVIGVFYVGYAFVIASLGTSQLAILYGGKAAAHDITGPFVNRNSFATYAGLIALCAGACLGEEVWSKLPVRQGVRRFAYSIVQQLTGRGVPYLLAVLMAWGAVIATASRAGNFATVAAMIAMLLVAARVGARHGFVRSLSSAGLALFAVVIVLFAIYGDTLAVRLNDISVDGLSDDLRLQLWDAATRMVKDAPFFGLGLGSYQTAYPMYGDSVLPLIMDKAHNDWLELAAGWGVIASALWWLALGSLAAACLRGVGARRRDRGFTVIAVGAIVLVAAHSAFDFSLQMPAIALTFAVLLGLGVAQSFSSRAIAHERAWSEPALIAARVLVLIPMIALPALAWPRLIDGLAEDAAAPATTRMVVNRPLPRRVYERETRFLTAALPANGDAQILRAEGLTKLDAKPNTTAPILKQALAASPGAARGWFLLAQVDAARNPAEAHDAFALGLLLAPREYYLRTSRVVAGAPLWSRLSPSEREQLLDDVRAMLDDPRQSTAVSAVLAAPGGPAVVTASFTGHPDALRAFNRARARQRLGL